MVKRLFLLLILLTLGPMVLADPTPHFNVQMENQSEKPAWLSFQNVGNVSLQPVLTDNTLLPSKQQSIQYKVYFDPLTIQDNFNIIFKGKQNCIFNIAYFAPGSPKITVSGLGCNGGGYRIIDSGETLLLYVTDIHK